MNVDHSTSSQRGICWWALASLTPGECLYLKSRSEWWRNEKCFQKEACVSGPSLRSRPVHIPTWNLETNSVAGNKVFPKLSKRGMWGETLASLAPADDRLTPQFNVFFRNNVCCISFEAACNIPSCSQYNWSIIEGIYENFSLKRWVEFTCEFRNGKF
jgi:hypothetical protein